VQVLHESFEIDPRLPQNTPQGTRSNRVTHGNGHVPIASNESDMGTGLPDLRES
jgi:hypothetical protein